MTHEFLVIVSTHNAMCHAIHARLEINIQMLHNRYAAQCGRESLCEHEQAGMTHYNQCLRECLLLIILVNVSDLIWSEILYNSMLTSGVIAPSALNTGNYPTG